MKKNKRTHILEITYYIVGFTIIDAILSLLQLNQESWLRIVLTDRAGNIFLSIAYNVVIFTFLFLVMVVTRKLLAKRKQKKSE